MLRPLTPMNTKRLILAIVAGIVFIFLSNGLIHGVWMKALYAETAALWRTEDEMNARMCWMFAGQLLAVLTFVVLWARGFAETGKPSCAVRYGLFMGLFVQSNTLITYVVTPVPPAIPVRWFLAGLVQFMLLALLTYYVYRPKPPGAPA